MINYLYYLKCCCSEVNPEFEEDFEDAFDFLNKKYVVLPPINTQNLVQQSYGQNNDWIRQTSRRDSITAEEHFVIYRLEQIIGNESVVKLITVNLRGVKLR